MLSRSYGRKNIEREILIKIVTSLSNAKMFTNNSN